MTIISRLNIGKMKGSWFLASIVFLALLAAIPPSIAAPMETSTIILSNVGAVGSDDIIQFSVWVLSGFDPVPTGSIRIIDTNTSEYIDSIVFGGKAVVNWTISEPFTEGIHVFEAVYQGFLDYVPSSGQCKIHFDDFSPGTSRTTSITLETNSSVVFKNASIRFTVELMINYQWYFQGGYVYVKNTNLSGSPTIHTYGPLPNYYPGTSPAIMTFSFDFWIPMFSPIGINSFIAEYTGSSQSGTLSCVSGSKNVTVLSTGYWLIQNLDRDELQREEDTVEFNTTVLGDYPVGLELYSYYYLDGKKVVISDQILESRNIIAHFSPNSSVPVGVLSIITELIDPSTKLQYLNSTEDVVIKDHARIDHSENATDFRHNETVRFEVYVTEEDVYTHPVVSKVEFVDITDGNRSLLNKTTNQDGFIVIEYPIPNNSTVGNHVYSLGTHDTNDFIVDITEIVTINIKGLTEIDITYESGGVDRNTNTVIEVTILSGGVAISEGLVALEFAVNSSVIEVQDCEPGLQFDYFIKTSHPLGGTDYQIHYYNSENYDDLTEDFDITVFSNPTINTTGQNASKVLKGHTVRIWGQLVDEMGNPLAFEEVELTDTTIGMILNTSETDDQGIFYYDYYISEATRIGFHFIEISYKGNIFEFYHSVTNTPVISITVRPPLSVIIETEVLANYWTLISLEGGLNDEISLEWQKSGETEWFYLTSVILNSTGKGHYNWSTPYYKGEFYLQATGPNSTKYDFSTMYAIPGISVSSDIIGNVNDPFSFTINCTERYQIWIGNQLWQDWQEVGTHQYEYIFQNRGMKEITIISNGTYVYYQEFLHNIPVYEAIFVSLSAPTEALVNITVNLDGGIIGEVSGPIQGINAILEVNGTDIQVDSTNGAGTYEFLFDFLTPGFYSLRVKTPINEGEYYLAGFSEESIISINSIPANIQVLSPLNETYGAIVEINIQGDALNYWYRIEPGDSTNLSWSSPTYRILAEGNYSCYVYGRNSYGIVTCIYSSFTVDTTAPSLVLISPVNTTYTTNEVLVSYLTNEDEVLVFLDRYEIENVELGSNLNDLKEGTHNLTIRTQDQVGNFITRTALFIIDTIPPTLEIRSPYNQSYTGEIDISLGSNGSTVLYFISNFHSYNQTYSETFTLNLSIGYYILNVYSYDDAGNVRTGRVSFSIVHAIDLLINPNCDLIDEAGIYLVQAQINHPNLDTVGIYLNGTYFGALEQSYIHQDYRLFVQLEVPGFWELTLFANTTFEEYDFQYFEIEWDPPAPIFETISISFDPNFYEVRVRIDSGSLVLETVQVLYNETLYDLTYEYFGDRWVGNLPFQPQNSTLIFYTFFPWDVEPSAQQEYNVRWYAPSMKQEFRSYRTNFTLRIQIEKQNASIDISSVTLIISNGLYEIEVNETSFYESISGNYQEWVFYSPNLPPNLWNYTIKVADTHSVERILKGIFNATDTPPWFGNESSTLVAKYPTGELWRIEVLVRDDYEVDRVLLFTDGVESSIISQNGSYFIFEIWLEEGVHSLQLVAYDDIGQGTTKILRSIHVAFNQSTSSIINTEELTTPTSYSSGTMGSSKTKENKGNNDFLELGFAGSLFVALIGGGNVLNRKRRG